MGFFSFSLFFIYIWWPEDNFLTSRPDWQKQTRSVAGFHLKRAWSQIVFIGRSPRLAAVSLGQSPCTRVDKAGENSNASEHLQLHQTSPILPPTPQFSWLSIVSNKRAWHFELEAVMDRFWGQKPLPVYWFHPSPVQLQAWIDSSKLCEDLKHY